MKPSNPKDLVGSSKLPLHLWPETATALGCLGMLDGGLKYGRANWREIGVKASIYYDAARRHLNAWFEGENTDPDSGLPHLAHALSCLAIIIDASAAGKLTDDRQYPGGYRTLINELTPHVERLKKLHEGKNPQHYSIGAPETTVSVSEMCQDIKRREDVWYYRDLRDDIGSGEDAPKEDDAMTRAIRQKLGEVAAAQLRHEEQEIMKGVSLGSLGLNLGRMDGEAA